MAYWLDNADILTPDGFKPGHAILIEDGMIAEMNPSQTIGENDPRERYDLQGKQLVPGFIDTQVNGGGGVLFNNNPCVDTIRTIADAHRAFGTTGMLPTLVSDDLSVVKKAIEAVDKAIEGGVPGILGIHLEGPFLNPVKKGVHDESKFRQLDRDAVALLSSLKHGKTLVTLAPEQTTPDMIQALADAGVIVAAGHTNATYDEIQIALENGLTGFTHLFNAMSGFQSRAPGVVGAALEDESSYTGIIADGYHVHPASMRVALKAKGAEKMVLVTDAMSSVGAENKDFMLQGRLVSVVDGKCTVEGGGLAGSDLDMIGAVNNAVNLMGVDLETASMMASKNPASYIGVTETHGVIACGKQADLVLLDENCQIDCVWVKGQKFGKI